MIHSILFAAAGFVAGAFTPSVGRKIKSFFVKETTAAKTAATSAASSAVAAAEKKL
jgi:hypothetical protein